MIDEHMVVSTWQGMNNGSNCFFRFRIQIFIIRALHKRMFRIKQIKARSVLLAHRYILVEHILIKPACIKQVPPFIAGFWMQHIHSESNQQPQQGIPLLRRFSLNILDFMGAEKRFPNADRRTRSIQPQNWNDRFRQNRIHHNQSLLIQNAQITIIYKNKCFCFDYITTIG